MVGPRFTRLPEAQQKAIVQAAIAEFAGHGFADASLNRIIAAAGISKGSMYYYFDGKEDLFAYVAKAALGHVLAEVGPPPELDVDDADEFWSRIEAFYLSAARTLTASPQLAALIRAWAAASKSPPFQQATEELERASEPWVELALRAGQKAGAVRSDLPDSLLMAVVLAMGEAMDVWLMSANADDDSLPGVISTLMGMMRRAVS